MPAPERYPSNAQSVIFFKYQIKSIFSIPITATPAAEPIMSKLPPVPAQYAKPSQNAPSWTKKCNEGSASACAASAIGYIPIEAATKGTLSIIEDNTPMIRLIA